MFAGVIACLGVGILSWNCSSPGQVGAGGGATGNGGGGAGGVTINTNPDGGASGTGGDTSGGGTTGAAGTTGSVDGTCGTTTITPNQAPADILIVLDRSASMDYSISGDCYCTVGVGGTGQGQVCQTTAGCTDRWTAVKTAVSQTVTANAGIEWGLEMFAAPGGGNCSVSLTPQVAISSGSADLVQAQITGTSPSSYTPTASAINAAILYLQTVNDGNPKAILLATDGEPNCGSNQASTNSDLPNTIAAIHSAASLGFPVYVVGIGPSVTNLDSMAQAGGTTNYYPATSPQQLTDALDKISKIVALPCNFQTPQVPPDASQVFVYVDKNLVTQNDPNGWTFGATTSDIVLTGTQCDAVGQASTVQIVFGCPGYIPPSIIP
jgi:hypothetical protein